MIASRLRTHCFIIGFTAVAALPSGLGAFAAANDPPAGAPTTKPNLCEHALRLLQEGNQRFIDGKPTHPNTDVFRVGDTGSHGQHPFASIVTCADSRVAVERLFDRGVGDLFVVRVAGAIADPNQTGSVEYACEHLGTQLVVVMGHTMCGAVKAAVAGGDAGKNIGSLLDNITPAVQATRAKHPDLTGDELVEAAVRENVWKTVEDMLRGSAMLREKAASGNTRVVGAVYNIENGRVEWLGMHPALAGLLKNSGEMQEAAAQPAPAPVVDAKPIEKPSAAKPASEKPQGTPSASKPAPSKPAPAKPNDHDANAPAHTSHPH